MRQLENSTHLRQRQVSGFSIQACKVRIDFEGESRCPIPTAPARMKSRSHFLGALSQIGADQGHEHRTEGKGLCPRLLGQIAQIGIRFLTCLVVERSALYYK